jgi:hypothetical protein
MTWYWSALFLNKDYPFFGTNSILGNCKPLINGLGIETVIFGTGNLWANIE